MYRIILIILSLFSFQLLAETTVTEQTLPVSVPELRTYLDVVNFELKGDEKTALLDQLIDHAELLTKGKSEDSGHLMMAGFFNAMRARTIDGIGALKYANAARKYLEQSIELDPYLYGSSALCVLGNMYYTLPGWPIAFGNKKKARQLIEKAVSLSPNGIDANVTYARLLLAENEPTLAKKFLLRAQQAPSRPDRAKADEMIQNKIIETLAKLNDS